MSSLVSADFYSQYQTLGPEFFRPQQPTAVAGPELIRVNRDLAGFFNLDAEDLNSDPALQCLCGNRLPEHSRPVATVYAGHQFGHWNPQLGDGRAILLGELRGRDGNLYELQLKGGGQTPYSRMGDGRSPLGPVLREYLVSEAMFSLGIPTTRALAAVSTGEQVVRDRLLPGAILTRVARSHVRVGTFQFFAARQNTEAIRKLADFVIDRHYRQVIDAEFAGEPCLGLLTAVTQAQATLVARWQSIGFIHGVMNTDNMLLSGETVDFGPCAFMDEYQPDKVFSSIDTGGRYAFQNQPLIARWNLGWLAQSLLPLIDADEDRAIGKVETVLAEAAEVFAQEYDRCMAAKLGFSESSSAISSLADEWLALLAAHNSDFSLSFRALLDELEGSEGTELRVDGLFSLPSAFDDWLHRWRACLQQAGISSRQAQTTLQQHNPFFIPRNHAIEAAISEATDEQDYSLFHELVEVLARPFEKQPEHLHLAMPPKPEQRVLRTFCGT